MSESSSARAAQSRPKSSARISRRARSRTLSVRLMMRRRVLFTAALALLLALLAFAQSPPRAEGLAPVRGERRTESQYQYPFQNPALPAEERITNILSLLTLEEKVACLGTNPSVPRLGIRAAGHMEG